MPCVTDKNTYATWVNNKIARMTSHFVNNRRICQLSNVNTVDLFSFHIARDNNASETVEDLS